ncbi:MAG: carboxypeptidase regulatory-like domain-containing protein [Candidatus Eremiobacteraeota bacterium]|nr:carboxypeptidase regulatory-like domain-containing protein [Candidatus Eremiobacteraeota bacterium]
MRVLDYLVILVVLLLVQGCGDSSTDLQGPTAASGTPPAPNIAGTVRDEAGEPVAGARVIVMGRRSREKFETVSSAAGNFALDVPGQETFDLGLDMEDGGVTATCFYGPVAPSTTPREYRLKSAAGLPTDTLFGVINKTSGVPAVGWTVTAHSSAVVSAGPSPVELPSDSRATVAADGSFRLQLGSEEEVGLDLELYEPDLMLDEFVPIAKLAEPCYIELTTESSPVENLYRYSEVPVEERFIDTPPAKAPSGVIVEKGRGRSNQVTDAEITNILVPNVDNHSLSRFFRDLVTAPSGPEWNLYRKVFGNGWISSTRNGSWWYRYAVEITIEGGAEFYFYDATGDRYFLGVLLNFGGPLNRHKVSYNSSAPDIVRIEIIRIIEPLINNI